MAKTPIISVPELDSAIPSLQWNNAEQTGEELTTTTVLTGKADRQQLFNNPIFNSIKSGSLGEYGFYAGHRISYGYNDMDILSLTCIDLTVALKDGYYTKFETTARTENIPLEQKQVAINDGDDTTYLAWWNHEVRANEVSLDLSPAQKTALRQLPDLVGGTGIDGYYWAKTNQGLKSTERVFMAAALPGTQSYGVGFEQVTQYLYTRSEGIAKDALTAVGSLRVPRTQEPNPVYYDANRVDPTTWLVTNGSYRKNYGWYEARLNYAYAKGGWLQYDPGDDPEVKVYPTFVT